jgi:hypothetical protein
VSTEPAPRPARPSRPRRPPKRKIGLTLALLLMGLTLVLGVIVGYASRGGSPPAKLVTQTRTVPVVTVTVPAAP